MTKKNIAIAAPCIWAAIVFWLHVGRMPHSEDTSWLPPHSDKLIHFTLFFTLAFLLARTWIFIGQPKRRSLFVSIVLLCLTYGSVLEWIQSHLSYRGADIFDLFADGLGSVFGIWLALTHLLPAIWRK
jgi:VanZ family protein